MNVNRSNYIVGFFLIGLGILWIIGNFVQQFSLWSLLWPSFILLPGLFLFMLWKSRPDPMKDWGILIPATILTSLSVLFFFNMLVTVIFDYGTIWAWTAFGYTASVGLAFLVSGLATARKSLFEVAKILGVVSIFIFFAVGVPLLFFTVIPGNLGKKLWPLIFIFLGIIPIFQKTLRSLFKKDGKYFGKSEEEWKDWGEKLGEDIRNSVEGK